MQTSINKTAKKLSALIVIALSLALLVSAVVMLGNYKNEIADRSGAKAMYLTSGARQDFTDRLAEYTTKAVALAQTVADITELNELTNFFNNYHDKDTVKYIRYFDGADLHDEAKNTIVRPSDPCVAYHEATDAKAGYVGSFYDPDNEMMISAFYAPVTGSSLMNAVMLYYPRNTVESFYSGKQEGSLAEFSVLTTGSGDIIVGREQVENPDLFGYFQSRVGNPDPLAKIKSLIENGEDGTVSVTIDNVDYTVSVGADSVRMRDLAIVEMYSVEALCASGFEFVQSIIGILIFFAVIAAFVIAYLFFNRINLEKQVLSLETYDPKFECSNRYGFEKETEKIFERNHSTYFAVIIFHVKHYKHVLERFGESEANRLVAFLRMTCAKTVGLEETYGYAGDGEFLLLLHAKNRESLLERLKIHSFLATQYRGAHEFDLHLKYGIYETDANERIPASQMVDFASEANNAITHATAENAGMVFNFYDSELRKIRLLNEEMELRMEGALQNGEFQVFYQPKYNLNVGKQDGSEALVRWYDVKTGEYNRPALFMQLFETNGFIVKLDKYVYTKVCEYISYSIAQGRTVFPVSVNVSRITAVQPDFIDYYSKTKRKYGIADGEIMIEFTESFAYENYDILKDIVDGLHKSGFKCSIDDFGCGYSSYRILKSLPMDEIKLDKFFLEKSFDEKRDDSIFRSIIALGKELGMKVTQEGVEDPEEVKRLRSLGVDVIQGYYYSHPLSLSDFLNFVANTREHNIT